MDRDWMLESFDEIEKKIENLIKTCEMLEEKNVHLEEKVSRLEIEIQDKNEAENIYKEQKAMVRKRIDGLLMKLNEFSDYKERN